MIHRFFENLRREKKFSELEARIAAMQLGVTYQEKKEHTRQRRSADAFAWFCIAIGAAGIVFAATDPIFDTLDLLIKELT